MSKVYAAISHNQHKNHQTDVRKVNEKIKITKYVRFIYILRRAVWLGAVNNSDIQRAFDTNHTQASSDLNEACKKYSIYLQRDKRGVSRKGADLPRPYPSNIQQRSSLDVDVTAKRVLYAVQNQTPHEGHLGFNPVGVVSRRSFVKEELPEEDVIRPLLAAIFNKMALEIKYVGLKKGEVGRWRQMQPMQFEFLDGHWRLQALDASGPQDFAIAKWFLLSRILDVRPLSGSCPSKLLLNKYENSSDAIIKLQITLNNDLTDDQKKVVSRQLGLNNGTVEMMRKDVFDFKRRYAESNIEKKNDIVWPLVTSIKEL